MYRSAKLQAAKCGARQLWITACVLGLVGMCYSVSAFAEPVIERETEALIDVQTDILTDADLSMVEGMGEAAAKLEANETLAVILWDERGGTSRRTTFNDSDGNHNSQSVSLTVNQR